METVMILGKRVPKMPFAYRARVNGRRQHPANRINWCQKNITPEVFDATMKTETRQKYQLLGDLMSRHSGPVFGVITPKYLQTHYHSDIRPRIDKRMRHYWDTMVSAIEAAGQ